MSAKQKMTLIVMASVLTMLFVCFAVWVDASIRVDNNVAAYQVTLDAMQFHVTQTIAAHQ